MEIKNSQMEDLNKIFDLYKIATDFQKMKSVVPWPEFDQELVKKEISEKRQWKIVIDNQIACIWATTENDPQIWEERNEDPAIYIHRISTHPDFKGRGLVNEIVTWSRDFAKEKNKKYVRMDTV